LLNLKNNNTKLLYDELFFNIFFIISIFKIVKNLFYLFFFNKALLLSWRLSFYKSSINNLIKIFSIKNLFINIFIFFYLKKISLFIQNDNNSLIVKLLYLLFIWTFFICFLFNYTANTSIWTQLVLLYSETFQYLNLILYFIAWYII